MSSPCVSRTPYYTVLAFLLPSLLGFSIFVLLPVLGGAILSLTDFSGGISFNLIDFQNYNQLFHDSQFWKALKITFIFSIISVPVTIAISIFFAVILNGKILFKNTLRGIFVLPSVLSVIAIALAFSMIFDPSSGLLNNVLQSLGLEAQGWLSDSHQVLSVVIFFFIWQNFGYYMIIFIGGLQTIPRTLYEAAKIDGAGSFQQFFKITLPMLSPVIFLSVILLMIRSFQVFNEVFILTGGSFGGGGPNGAARVLVFDIYMNSFIHYKMGYAAAESIILLLIVLTITFVQYKFQRKWVNYES